MHKTEQLLGFCTTLGPCGRNSVRAGFFLCLNLGSKGVQMAFRKVARIGTHSALGMPEARACQAQLSHPWWLHAQVLEQLQKYLASTQQQLEGQPRTSSGGARGSTSGGLPRPPQVSHFDSSSMERRSELEQYADLVSEKVGLAGGPAG